MSVLKHTRLAVHITNAVACICKLRETRWIGANRVCHFHSVTLQSLSKPFNTAITAWKLAKLCHVLNHADKDELIGSFASMNA